MASQNITAFVLARKVRASAFKTPSVTNSPDKSHVAQSAQAPTPQGASSPGAPKNSARLLRADTAQALLGDTLFQDGVTKESAPAFLDIPPMADQERRDLELLAGRSLNEEQARDFWRSLVIAAAVQHWSCGSTGVRP